MNKFDINKPKIGIDLDDTLNDLKSVWVDRYNELYNDNLLCDNVLDWDISKYVKKECGQKIYNILDDKHLFLNLEPQKDSIDVTKKLSEFFNIFIISSSYPQHVVDKVKWIEKYLPHIPKDRFISCSHKHLINVDYLIDDYHENLRNFNGVRILYNQSHNQNIDNVVINKRVFNWEEISNFLIPKIELKERCVNTNGRIYPKEIFEREFEKYQIKIRERGSYGELNHPSEYYSSDNQIFTDIKEIINGYNKIKI